MKLLHAGGRGRAARLGLHVRDAARGGGHDRRRRAPRRSRRRGRRRSVDRVAGLRRGAAVRRVGRRAATGRHPARRRPAHRRRPRVRRRRPRRRLGVGLPRGRLRRAVGGAQLQRERRGRAHHAGRGAGRSGARRDLAARAPARSRRTRSTPATAEIDGVDRSRAAAGQRAPDDLAARVPAGGAGHAHGRVDNPTRFFVEGLRLALAESRHPSSRGGAWDIDDVQRSAGRGGPRA